MSDPFHEGREAARARRLRSLAIAAALVFLVVITFVVTLTKMAANTPGPHAP